LRYAVTVFSYGGWSMSKHEKLLRRIASRSKDFKWSELISLMTGLGFDYQTASGSARKFIQPQSGAILYIHEPHPAKLLKQYQIRDAVDFLKGEGLLP
jgi:hypothetical protein